MLLRREMPLGGFSLDHLYVDQRAILTLVETKLFQNPESRREVIGQVIEYAANAADLWGTGRTRQYASEFWSNQGKDLDAILQNEFGTDLDIEAFWNRIEVNLNDGLIRLIIAADELRPEVRRMIEYLNREMKKAEVLGLEIKCYGDDKTSMVLVPRLMGQTIIDKQPPGGKVTIWNPDRLRIAYEQLPGETLRQRLVTVLEWAVLHHFFIENTAQFPCFGLRGKNKGRIISFFSNGSIFSYVNEKCYSGGAEERDQLCDDLKKLGMMDQNLDPRMVVDGRNLTRKLTELSEEELRALLDLYAKYCA